MSEVYYIRKKDDLNFLLKIYMARGNVQDW